MESPKGNVTDGVRLDQTEEAVKAPAAPQAEAPKRELTPLTLAELKAKNLENHFVMPDAHRWMVGEKLDRLDNPFNKELRFVVIRRRMENLGRQLTLAETQEAVNFLRNKRKMDGERHEQYKKLLDLRTDDTSPNKEGESCIAKVTKTCQGQFVPTARYKVFNDKRVVKDGKDVQLGSYGIFRVDARGNINPTTGELMALGVCKECAMSGEINGVILYTFEDAGAKIAKIKAQEEAEKDREKRADVLKSSLVAPEGEPRFNSGFATRDIDATSKFLESRRNKGSFQGRRDHRDRGRRDR